MGHQALLKIPPNTLSIVEKERFMDLFNRQRLPQRRYPSSSSPVPSNYASSPRRRQIAAAHGPRAAVLPKAARSDRRQASCGSDWIRSSSHCFRPHLAVGVNRAAGVYDLSRMRDRARATLYLGSMALLRSERWPAKNCERRRQVARRSLMASAREGYRRAQHLGAASHYYDV